jgi:hypothetical protein
MDLLFAVDTSGSMGEENYFIEQQLNGFHQQLATAGVDARIITLAEPVPPVPCSGIACPTGICVDAPLGSGTCPDDDNPPSYHHLASWGVQSNDGLTVLIDSYADWASLLRPRAGAIVVAVSDDDATDAPYGSDPAQFVADFTALDARLAGWKMAAIYAFTLCSDATSVGTNWASVVDATGGLEGDLCLQDFGPFFDALADDAIASAPDSCLWELPDTPASVTFRPDEVNVVFIDGASAEHPLLYVADEASCDGTAGGWYYDDPVSPTQIVLCPASCATATTDAEGRLEAGFGCPTDSA